MQAEKKKEMISEDERMAQLLAFVSGSAFNGAAIEPLRMDASVRRFFRLRLGDKTAIMMDARPPLEDTAVFETMQKKLSAIGLTVPDIYAVDHEHGIVIMEDFGDIRFYELVTQKKEDIQKLYTLATDVLVHKYFADPAVALAESAAYSDEYWLFRVEQFLLHYMPHVMNRVPTSEMRKEFLELFHDAITNAHKFPDVLLHGDYGAQNLYYLPRRAGVKALGLIDFQDMTDARGNMMGSPAFDLVFLLQDVRVDLPEGLEDAMKKRFMEKTGITDTVAFDGEYATIGLAQAVKCLGLFARLGYGAGRTEYLPFIAYCWRNVEKNWNHPALAKIKNWFEKNDIKKG